MRRGEGVDLAGETVVLHRRENLVNRGAVAAVVRFHTTTSRAASFRRPAIRLPIAPSPMTATGA